MRFRNGKALPFSVECDALGLKYPVSVRKGLEARVIDNGFSALKRRSDDDG